MDVIQEKVVPVVIYSICVITLNNEVVNELKNNRFILTCDVHN
jgi:hypothetical protein